MITTKIDNNNKLVISLYNNQKHDEYCTVLMNVISSEYKHIYFASFKNSNLLQKIKRWRTIRNNLFV